MSFNLNPEPHRNDLETQLTPIEKVHLYKSEQSSSLEKTDSARGELKDAGGNRHTHPAFQKFNEILLRLGGETRGIERIDEKDRHDEGMWTAISMFLGCNFVIAAFALGCLGRTIWKLSFWESFGSIVGFALLGCIQTGFFATFGPSSGMRQTVLSRFWFGYQAVRLISLINLLSMVGWTSVNTMSSAVLLHRINDGGIPEWAAVLIISLLSFFATMLGYKYVHFYEMYAWIPSFFAYIVIAARMGMSKEFVFTEPDHIPASAASILSFGAAILGFATGWSPYAADYNAYKPTDTPKLKLFLSVYLGEATPFICSAILGAACATGLANPKWNEAYEKNQTGGLLWMILVQDSLHGFGQFVMVILALSTVANNVPNLYSFGFALNVVCEWTMMIPRLIWTLVITGVSIGIAIAGLNHFDNFLRSFMNIIGYVVGLYAGVCLANHFVFRRGTFAAYELEAYDNRRRIFFGWSGLIGIGCGVLGFVMGMSQPRFGSKDGYVGPIARLIGSKEAGGDIGFFLALSFSFVGYTIAHYVEKRLTHSISYTPAYR